MKIVRARIARGFALGAIGLALMLPLGCRRSKTQGEEERREKIDVQKEREVKRQEAAASARQDYESGKELIAQRRYEEGWKTFEDAAARDETIGFEFKLYSSERLPEQLFKVADDLSSIEKRQFNEAYRALGFVRDHIEKKRPKAEKKIKYLRHLWEADKRYYKGLRLIEQYQRAEGIRLLEEVRDNFQDTPYFDLAVKKLVELQPPDAPPVH